MNAVMLILFATALAATPLESGDTVRKITVDSRERSYLLHVPPHHDANKPTPVLLVFHGAGMNGPLMALFCGMNSKSDEAGFLAVYPNGTGTGPFLTFNSGGVQGAAVKDRPDDVKFTTQLLDDLGTVVKVDPNRVYATGISNGGMMSYRLAAELSDRIAAIGPVAGTMAIDDPQPTRPVSVMHFHGTADSIVPMAGAGKGTPKFLTFQSVEESIQFWVKHNHCPRQPMVVDEPDREDDGTQVKRSAYGPGQEQTEVILYAIEGGGHTWPGQKPLIGLIGKSTLDVSANDLLWQFFEKHPKK